jgi:hypothetical protein
MKNSWQVGERVSAKTEESVEKPQMATVIAMKEFGDMVRVHFELNNQRE